MVITIKTSVNYQSIIDEDLIRLITYYSHLDLGEISLKSIVKGMLIELKDTDPDHSKHPGQIEIGIAFQITLSHLFIHPHYYDGVELMLDILNLGGLEKLQELAAQLHSETAK